MGSTQAIVSAVAVCVILAAAACTQTDEPAALVFEPHELTRSADGCEPGTSGCAWVRLRWLEATAGPETATAAVNEWITARVLEPLGDHWTVRTPEDIATSLLADRDDFLHEFPDAATGGWYLEREVRRLPAPNHVISLELTERQYMGGAHGMESVRLVSFDHDTGSVLGLNDLVPSAERDAFEDAVNRAFRELRGLDPHEDLRDAGFFVDQNSLPTTDNIALVQDGIRLHYDAYEIAPYAMGPTDLVVAD